ncbi:MAG: hypothetical protein ATN35_02815 [Epulopiscium sp. Nele67-Bin004]|nr:MAG: hypothetical protein ATN35_02815 [Epulopiscium sp. Nele67-Bin004]
MDQQNMDLEEVIILTINFEGKVISANQYAKNRLKLDDADFSTKNIVKFVTESDKPKIKEILHKASLNRTKNSIDLTFEVGEGQQIYTVCTLDPNINTKQIELTAIDVKKYNLTPRTTKYLKKLHTALEEKKFRLERAHKKLINNLPMESDIFDAIDKIPDHMMTIMCKYNIKKRELSSVKVSSAVENYNFISAGYQGIIDRNMFDTRTWAKIHQSHQQGLHSLDTEYKLEGKYNHPYNGPVWVYIIVKYMASQEQDMVNVVISIVDIDSEKMTEEHMLKTLYDPLTETPNNDYFVRYFREHRTEKMTLIYFDLDNFKFVNDSFGRKYGDYTLREIVDRIKSIENDKFIIGRINADEFIVILEDVTTKEEIKQFMATMGEVFSKTFSIQGINFGLTYSAGVAVYPKDGTDFESLFNNADIAMHKVKEEGKRNYTFYHPSFRHNILEKMYMESDLREALKRGEFTLYYQPQVNITNGRIRGFEALVRWIKPDGRIIPPFKFITSAEETRLMIPLGEWIFREACLFINKLKVLGYDDLHIAINISGVQIADDDFIDTMTDIIKDVKVDTKNVHLEITETVLMTDLATNTKKIKQLQDMGILIALDDFGVGYSSLTYLKQFPIDILKIEKAFVDDIGTHRKNLVGSIINLGHELDLEVVAEGVEESDQLQYLVQNNCDILQGYLVSKPMPEADVLEFLAREY